ncbi:MAG: M23 family metallopeptidase, partial [bacterium]
MEPKIRTLLLKVLVSVMLVSGFSAVSSLYAFEYWPRTDKDVNAILGEYRGPTGTPHFHGGIDMPNQNGQPVYAVESGHVVHTSDTTVLPPQGTGYMVIIDHSNGTRTRYLHLSSILVQNDTDVTDHQEVGKVGGTGGNYGPHLHFEVRDSHSNSANFLNPFSSLPALTGADADNNDPILEHTCVIQLNEAGKLLGPSKKISLPSIDPADPYGSAPDTYVSGRVRQLIHGFDRINAGGKQGFYRLNHSIYSYQTETELTSYQITFDTVAYTERSREEWVYSDGSDIGTSSYCSRIGGSGTQYYYKLYNDKTPTTELIQNIIINDTSDILEDDGTWKTKKAKDGVPQDAYGNATKNADARTPDGRYRCEYHAYDFAENRKDSYLHVYVNNFNQEVGSCDSSGDTWNTFFVGETVRAKGSEYVPGESYNLYVFPHQLLLDGADIPTWGGFPIEVTADANGEFMQAIWTPGSGNVGKYDIIVDYDGDGKYSQPVNNIAVDGADGQFADFGFEVKAAPTRVLRIPVYYEDPWGGTHPVPPGTFAKVSKFYAEAQTPAGYEYWLEMNLRVNEDSELVFETTLDCELYEQECDPPDPHKLRVFLESFITAIEPGEGPNDQEVYLARRPSPQPYAPWSYRYASSLFCIEGVGGNVWMPVGGEVVIHYNYPVSTLIEYDSLYHEKVFLNQTGAIAAMDKIHKGYHYMRGLDPSLAGVSGAGAPGYYGQPQGSPIQAGAGSAEAPAAGIAGAEVESVTGLRVTAIWSEGRDWHDESGYGYLPDNTTCYAPKSEGSSVMRLFIDGQHFDEWSEVYLLQGYANTLLSKHGPIEAPVLSHRDPISAHLEHLQTQALINAFSYYLPTTIASFPAILAAPARATQVETPRGIDNEMAVLDFLKAINDPALIWNALAHPILTPPAENYDVLDLANELKAQGMMIDDLLTEFGMKIKLISVTNTGTPNPTFTWDMNQIETGTHTVTLQIAEDDTFSAGLISIGGLIGESYTLSGHDLTDGFYYWRVGLEQDDLVDTYSAVGFFEIEAGGANTPPTITIIEPPAGGATADTEYVIYWQDADPDDNALVSLYYDLDDTGYNGVEIVS